MASTSEIPPVAVNAAADAADGADDSDAQSDQEKQPAAAEAVKEPAGDPTDTLERSSISTAPTIVPSETSPAAGSADAESGDGADDSDEQSDEEQEQKPEKGQEAEGEPTKTPEQSGDSTEPATGASEIAPAAGGADADAGAAAAEGPEGEVTQTPEEKSEVSAAPVTDADQILPAAGSADADSVDDADSAAQTDPKQQPPGAAAAEGPVGESAETPTADGVVVTSAPNEGYAKDMKIWNTGIKHDAVVGSKRGKGVQHLNSDYWMEDMGVFIQQQLPALQKILRTTEPEGYANSDFEYTFFLNQCNVLFIRALKGGLRSEKSLQQWLMASWLAMMAAEVDTYPYAKYSHAERRDARARIYRTYLEDRSMPQTPGSPWRRESGASFKMSDGGSDGLELDLDDGLLLAPLTRIDLLPAVALERLSLHNELCQVKMGAEGARQWMREGFPLSKRVDSVKRHIDEAHYKDHREDAVAHLVWNFMAVWHVRKLFPHLNDLFDYEALCRDRQ